MRPTLRPVPKQQMLLPGSITITSKQIHETPDRPQNQEDVMNREIIRVEPLSTYLERWKAPTSAVTRHGDTIYVSGFPAVRSRDRRSC